MASGDTKTQSYLRIAATGNRSDLPSDTCCNTKTQNLIVDVAGRIISLDEEVQRIKNNPDVADIVATYAALQNYPTSQLTDKDVIRVLEDETHDGASTYYRWSTSTQTFTYIGKAGSYYTKSETDTLLNGKQDTLTFDTTPTTNSTNPVTSGGIKTYVDTKARTFQPYPSTVNTTGTTQQFIASVQALNAPVGTAYLGTVELTDLPASLIQEEVQVYVYDNNLIYCIMYSADASPYMWWCNSYDYRGWEPMGGSSVNVVQTTGTSQTDVMSQNATTRMVYLDNARQHIVIGRDAQDNSGNYGIVIGFSAVKNSLNGVIVGNGSTLGANASAGLVLVNHASVTAQTGVALAYGSATQQGQFDVSTSNGWTGGGYNNSDYRLLTGLYDPQSAHDAATKGYVDTATASIPTELTNAQYEALWSNPNPVTVALASLTTGAGV